VIIDTEGRPAIRASAIVERLPETAVTARTPPDDVIHQGESKDSGSTADEAYKHATTDRPKDQSDRPNKEQEESDPPLPPTPVAKSDLNARELRHSMTSRCGALTGCA